MVPSQSDIERLGALYEQGKYVTAYKQTEALGGLDAFEGPAGCILAGRLASNLGAKRLGLAMHMRTYRAHPDETAISFYYGLALAHARGPIAALQFFEQVDETQLEETARADHFSARAILLAYLRDFEKADEAIGVALEVAPERPWLHVVRSTVLEAEDRQEEALDACLRALELQPFYRPAVQATTESLLKLNRDTEALDLLRFAVERLESGDLVAQLASLKTELGMYEEARQDLQRLRPYYPLLGRDRHMRKWYVAQLADAAYYCGDFDEAAELTGQVDTPFYQAIAKRLAATRDSGRRMMLDVGFTLQHYVTCAPATLSTLSKYWEMPVEHTEVAEEICYDGTPAHTERNWAEGHGFYAREFRVTWESTLALIDAGIPFTLTTVGLAAAHLQAVIGYDSRRGALLVRDPNQRHSTEYLAQELIEQLQSTGPRGMAFLPRDRASELDAIELPDADLYDLNFVLHMALERHERTAAEQVYRQMAAKDRRHRLTIYARARIANYDADQVKLLSCTEKLLKLFPNDPNQLSVKLRLLRENGTRAQRLEMLERICATRDCDQVFRQQYAHELMSDQRQHREAGRLLKRSLNKQPLDATCHGMTAEILWDQGNREEAVARLRIVSCLEDKDESRAMAYFTAARYLNRTEEALRYLRDRCARLGDRSSGPARTLAMAYDQLNKADQALAVLRQALARRPRDGELKLFAADFAARIGRHDAAQKLLKQSQGISHRTDWYRTAAQLAYYRNDLREAIAHGRKALEAEPLNRETNNLVAELVADLRGSAAAVDHFRKLLERFPHHYTLRTQLIDWLDNDNPCSKEKEVRTFLELHPDDPWAQRELASVLVGQRRWNQALAEADLACKLDPASPVGHHLRALVYKGLGKPDKARLCFRKAIGVSVDYDPAIVGLVQLCITKAERQEELRFVYAELVKQVISGDGLLTFREYAAAAFDSDRLLEVLRAALKSRQDLWHAWSAYVQQLLEMDRIDKALRYAKAAAERFPLLPKVWLDLARVYERTGQTASEVKAIKKALAVNARYGEALRQLAEAERRAEHPEAAKEALERAIAGDPQNITHHGALAELFWAEGDRPRAIETLRKAVRREPRYEWGWRQLGQWAQIVKEPEQVLDLAREITKDRPDSADAWLLLSEILSDFPEHDDECLQAAEQAVRLDRRHVNAHAMWAQRLAARGRFDEAIAACNPKALLEARPLVLRVRQAEVESQRGNLDIAIRQMEEVVREDPDYSYAWSQLSDWHCAQQENEQSLAAAENLLRTAPQSGAAWGYVGDALLRSDQREDAKRHFARSIELDPTYVFGAIHLFELQVDDRAYDDSLQTLRIVGPYLSDDQRLTREVRAHSLAGDLPEAISRLKHLCDAKLDNSQTLLQAVDAVLQSGGARQVKEVLAQAVRGSAANPHVAAALVEVLAREGNLSAIHKFSESLVNQKTIWHAFIAAYIEILGDANARNGLEAIVESQRDLLRRNVATWAAVGESYQSLDLYDDVLDWMEDWRARPDVEAHMLFPLVFSALSLGEDELAAEVANHAVQLPKDRATQYFRLILAALALEAEDVSRAADYFSFINPADYTDYYQAVYTLVKTTLQLLACAPESGTWRDARTRYQAARQSVLPILESDALIQRFDRQYELLLAQHYGSTLGTLAASLKAAWPRWGNGSASRA